MSGLKLKLSLIVIFLVCACQSSYGTEPLNTLGLGPYREFTPQESLLPYEGIVVTADGNSHQKLFNESQNSEEKQQELKKHVRHFQALVFSKLTTAHKFLLHIDPKVTAKIFSFDITQHTYAAHHLTIRAFFFDGGWVFQQHIEMRVADKLENHIFALRDNLTPIGTFLDQLIAKYDSATIAGMIRTQRLTTIEELDRATIHHEEAATVGEAESALNQINQEVSHLRERARAAHSFALDEEVRLEQLKAQVNAARAILENLKEEQRGLFDKFQVKLDLADNLGNLEMIQKESLRPTVQAGIRAFLLPLFEDLHRQVMIEAPQSGLKGIMKYDIISFNKIKFFHSTTPAKVLVRFFLESTRVPGALPLSMILSFDVDTATGEPLLNNSHLQQWQSFAIQIAATAKHLTGLRPFIQAVSAPNCEKVLGKASLEQEDPESK